VDEIKPAFTFLHAEIRVAAAKSKNFIFKINNNSSIGKFKSKKM